MKLLLKPAECLVIVTNDEGKEMQRFVLCNKVSFKILHLSEKFPSVCIPTKIKFVKNFEQNMIFVNGNEYTTDTEFLIVEDEYKPKFYLMLSKKQKKHLSMS